MKYLAYWLHKGRLRRVLIHSMGDATDVIPKEHRLAGEGIYYNIQLK